MGLLDAVFEGIISAGQFVTFIGAVLLAVISWPVVTPVTKFMILAAVGTMLVDEVALPTRDSDHYTVALGAGSAAIVWGFMSSW